MDQTLTITIVHPTHGSTRTGNHVTATRWQRILSDCGHRVHMSLEGDGANPDVLVAIHAWRSAGAISEFRRAHPERPVVVCLSGTDVYAFQHTDPTRTHASFEAATALVGLHDLVARSIPDRFAEKLRIIHQSSPPVTRRDLNPEAFDICVVGHLRAEKDPLRTAQAARLLPPTSRIRITHAGRAMDEAWAVAAEREMAENPRYHWVGERDARETASLLASSRLMVLTSTMEGGANVIGEALAAGTPVFSSAIEGSFGLLGEDYPGMFPAGDTAALAEILHRFETDPAFATRVSAASAARAYIFEPERERQAWRDLLADLTSA